MTNPNPSREIKFRAWDGRQWWSDVAVMDSEPYVWNYEETGLVPLQTPDQIARNGKAKVCEYTGLKDRNGKEIYEGDFIQYSSEIEKVEWVSGEWGYRGVMWANKGEVVGNVFEIPDLLK